MSRKIRHLYFNELLLLSLFGNTSIDAILVSITWDEDRHDCQAMTGVIPPLNRIFCPQFRAALHQLCERELAAVLCATRL